VGCFTPLPYLLTVKTTVRPSGERRLVGHPLARFPQQPPHVPTGMRPTPAQMTEEQLPLFGPNRQERMIPKLPIVGLVRALLAGRGWLIQTGLQVKRARGPATLRPYPLAPSPTPP